MSQAVACDSTIWKSMVKHQNTELQGIYKPSGHVIPPSLHLGATTHITKSVEPCLISYLTTGHTSYASVM